MKFLIHSGIKPDANSSVSDLLERKYNIGENVGNLCFINGVAASVDPDRNALFTPDYYRSSFSNAEIERINANYDGFILPLADAFREDNQASLANLTAAIKRLRIPCYVIGVGLRAPYEANITEPRSFDRTVYEFVSAVLEKSACIGVRGETTQAYLNRLGFAPDRQVMTIGCPSMCLAALGGGLKLKEFSPGENSRLCLNGNDLAPSEVHELYRDVIRTHGNSWIVQQRESEMLDLYLGGTKASRSNAFRTKGSMYGEELYEKLYKENRIRMFANLYTWIEFLSGMDLCLNSRFHGTVCSLLARVPSILITIDSRTRELAEYHRLSCVPASRIKQGMQLEDLLSMVDLHSPERAAQENLSRYFSFLDKNGLAHITADTVPDYYYTGTPNNFWKKPEPNANQVSANEVNRRQRALSFTKNLYRVRNKYLLKIR